LAKATPDGKPFRLPVLSSQGETPAEAGKVPQHVVDGVLAHVPASPEWFPYVNSAGKT
jgi:hypothetical protein